MTLKYTKWEIMKLKDQENMGDAELLAEARQFLINSENVDFPVSLVRCLYIGHFLSRWSASELCLQNVGILCSFIHD